MPATTPWLASFGRVVTLLVGQADGEPSQWVPGDKPGGGGACADIATGSGDPERTRGPGAEWAGRDVRGAMEALRAQMQGAREMLELQSDANQVVRAARRAVAYVLVTAHAHEGVNIRHHDAGCVADFPLNVPP